MRSRVQAIVRARELNLIIPTDEIELKSEEPAHTSIDLPEPINPYKGLRAFESVDQRNFFGREAALDRLLGKLESPASSSKVRKEAHGRFLTIVGPSSSGKSSLVKAGLIPALWSGALTGSDKWFVLNMVPGAQPLDALETARSRFSRDFTETECQQYLHQETCEEN